MIKCIIRFRKDFTGHSTVGTCSEFTAKKRSDEEAEMPAAQKLRQAKQIRSTAPLRDDNLQRKACLHSYLPQVFDVDTLAAQTLRDPEAIYKGLQGVIAENASLRVDIQKKNQEYEDLKARYTKTISQYEELCNIGTTKQVILWQYFHRLQMAGENFQPLSSAPAEVPTVIESSSISRSEKGDSIDSSRLDPHAVSLLTPRKFKRQMLTTSRMAFVPSPPMQRVSPQRTSSRTVLPKEMVAVIASTIAPRFRGICPNSLVNSYPCNILGCKMRRACAAHNDEDGRGCHNPKCGDVHELMTCLEEVDGLACSWLKVKKDQMRREAHFAKRVHKNDCSREEWKDREVIAGLRDAHNEGQYNGGRNWSYRVGLVGDFGD